MDAGREVEMIHLDFNKTFDTVLGHSHKEAKELQFKLNDCRVGT